MCEDGGNISTQDLVLFTSRPKNGLVVNVYASRTTDGRPFKPKKLGPISIPRGSRGDVYTYIYIYIYTNV